MKEIENVTTPEVVTTLLPTSADGGIDRKDTSGRCNADASADARSWTVLRVDDNGNKFVVREGFEERDAKAIVAEFEARGHKQVYWAEPAC